MVSVHSQGRRLLTKYFDAFKVVSHGVEGSSTRQRWFCSVRREVSRAKGHFSQRERTPDVKKGVSRSAKGHPA